MKRDVAALEEREHDLVVIGGGVYGAAAAWDAAQRGLAVALLERDDFCAGTSWNSLKTIHGGLRHLQRGELGLLRESVRERRALLRVAPGLVRPLPFLLPAYGHGPRGREVLAIGVRLNDLLSLDRNRGLAPGQRIPPARVLSRAEVLERTPGLPEAGLSGGVVWTDAQVESSERLVVAFACAAHEAGAVVANRLEATGLLRCGPRVTGVRARDREGGGELELRSRFVLNAAGPWLDDVLRSGGVRRPPTPLLRAFNLVLRRPLLAGHALGARSGGRFLFLVPWRGRALLGTAYAPPGADDAGEIAAFLADARAAFPWAGIGPDDVSLVHKGLVPGRGGRDGGGLWSHSLVVDHAAEDGAPGLVSLLGAKYTTARAVAERAVDLVAGRLGRRLAPCRTAVTPLAAARPPEGDLEARARHAVREEMALHLEDAVLRRLGLGSLGAPLAEDVDAVARAMAGELGWDASRVSHERSALRAAVAGARLREAEAG